MTLLYLNSKNELTRTTFEEIDFHKEGYVVVDDKIELNIEDLIRIEK